MTRQPQECNVPRNINLNRQPVPMQHYWPIRSKICQENGPNSPDPFPSQSVGLGMRLIQLELKRAWHGMAWQACAMAGNLNTHLSTERPLPDCSNQLAKECASEVSTLLLILEKPLNKQAPALRGRWHTQGSSVLQHWVVQWQNGGRVEHGLFWWHYTVQQASPVSHGTSATACVCMCMGHECVTLWIIQYMRTSHLLCGQNNKSHGKEHTQKHSYVYTTVVYPAVCACAMGR